MSYKNTLAMIAIKDLLEELDKHYRIIQTCSTSATRARHAMEMECIIKNHPETASYWRINTDAVWYSRRFTRLETSTTVRPNPYPEFEVKDGKIVDDGINYKTPDDGGAYLFGQTAYNPYTKKPYFAIKVGKADWFADRSVVYNTCCPFLFRIDYKSATNGYEVESFYQNKLKKIAFARTCMAKEWYVVDEATYLEICEKGFSYFD